MTPEDIEAPIGLLQRAPVLAACRDGPVGRSSIAERAGCSRSTAYRATGALTEQGWLERVERGYRLTGAGRAALRHAEAFRGRLAGTERLAPLLATVDAPALVERAALFSGAEVVEPAGEQPYRVESRVRELIAGTEDRMVGMTTGLGSPGLAEAMLERVEAGVEVEWILTPAMYERFTEGFGTLAEQSSEAEQTAGYVAQEIPIDLAVYDDTLVVIGFDAERGVLAAVAISDDDAAVAWGRDAFETCRAGAERLE